MHSDAQLTWFSSFSLGKTSKLLLRSLVRRFAGSSSVPAHVEMMGFLGIGRVMAAFVVNGSSLTFTTNAAITRPKATTRWLVLQKDKECPTCWAIAVGVSAALSK